jgi:hypothetical protein
MTRLGQEWNPEPLIICETGETPIRPHCEGIAFTNYRKAQAVYTRLRTQPIVRKHNLKVYVHSRVCSDLSHRYVASHAFTIQKLKFI